MIVMAIFFYSEFTSTYFESNFFVLFYCKKFCKVFFMKNRELIFNRLVYIYTYKYIIYIFMNKMMDQL